MTDQVGRVLGDRYRLNAPIGSGGSGQVFLAEDVSLRRQVAVKLLHAGLANDEAFLRRFRAEARFIANLNHPNIVAVYDWSEGEADEPYLVLEYLAGGSLRALLDTGRLLSLSQGLMVGLEAAQALEIAHRNGYVHRDIKPGNLLFGDDGRLRIADFGLASSLLEAAYTEPAGAGGTSRYLVPELASGARLDGKADIYALGLVLIEAVTGSVPLLADTMDGVVMSRANQPVPVPESMGQLRPILERMGQPNPQDRPTAVEVKQELLRISSTLDAPTPLPLVGAIDIRTSSERNDLTMMPGSRLSTDSEFSIGDKTAASKKNGVFDQADHQTNSLMNKAPSVPSSPMSTTKKKSRPSWLRVAIAVLLIAAFTAGGWFGWQALQPASAVVPDVDSLVLSEAQKILSDAQAAAGEGLGWKITVEKAFNETVEVGAIINQKPPAGARLDDGGRIILVVSDGPPPVKVPLDIVGKTEPEVEAALLGVGLLKGTAATLADEVIAAGQLITWRFGDLDRPVTVPKGLKVDLVLSAGPAPRLVPSLAGMTLEQATAELAKVNLGIAPIEEFHPSVKVGQVIRTHEATGSQVARDATVTVVISKGPDLVTVPNVRGLTLDQALDKLEASGLVVGEVFGHARGQPDSTDPDVGQKVPRGTKVDIILKR